MDRRLELTHLAHARHFWFAGFRDYVSPVLAGVAGGRRDLRLLDCGCGAGHNLPMLAPYGRVFGFDLSAGGLEIARAAGRPLVRADATRIPFASGQFDVVTAFDVAQCLPDDRTAVREMARVLRPGGALVMTMAALEWLRGDHSVVWEEARRYTPALARQLGAQAGLEVERVSFMFATLVPLMLPVRLLQRALRPWRGVRDDSDIGVPSAPVNAVLTAMVRAEAAASALVPLPFGSSLLVVARKPGRARG